MGELFNGNNLENVQLTLFINGEEAQSEFGDNNSISTSYKTGK